MTLVIPRLRLFLGLYSKSKCQSMCPLRRNFRIGWHVRTQEVTTWDENSRQKNVKEKKEKKDTEPKT